MNTKILLCVSLVVSMFKMGHLQGEFTDMFNFGSYRKVFTIGKCKPGKRLPQFGKQFHNFLLPTGDRLITEKLIKAPTKNDEDGTFIAYFRFSNIGYISISCVQLIIITDTLQIKYRISDGGIGRDYINLAVEGKNATVMMSRAIVYGIGLN